MRETQATIKSIVKSLYEKTSCKGITSIGCGHCIIDFLCIQFSTQVSFVYSHISCNIVTVFTFINIEIPVAGTRNRHLRFQDSWVYYCKGKEITVPKYSESIIKLTQSHFDITQFFGGKNKFY